MPNLITPNPVYKPFSYPWAFEAWKAHESMHWLPDEVPLADDVKDWNTKLTPQEKNLLTHIFRFFTQQDIMVGGAYVDQYMKVFQPTEVRMMLMGFASREAIHVAAYAHLLDTIGMPETEYSAFLKYAEMKEKFEYAQQFNVSTPKDTAKALAVFSAFMEGLQLFASFAMLMNFPRFNKMKGMGQVVAWSVRDESIHVECMITLFRAYVEENIEIWNDDFKKELYDIARTMVEHEDAFIDLAFEQGGIEGMTADDIKAYIRFIADRRLLQLGLKPNFGVKTNPLAWMDEVLNAPEFVNFFEGRVTEYSRATTKGTWDEAFATHEATSQLSLIVYGQANCPQCLTTKALLDSKQVPYEYRDLTGKNDEKQKMYEAHPEARSMPMIFSKEPFGDIFIGGYQQLFEMLNKD